MSVERNADNKIIPKRFAMWKLKAAAANDMGFCIACGEEAHNIEPDARKVYCPGCRLSYVYGAEEIVLLGLVDPGTSNDEDEDDEDFD